MSETLEQRIKRHESLGLKMYFVNGIPHIGYGHNLQARPITHSVADAIFDADLADTRQQCAKSVFPLIAPADEHPAIVIEVLVEMSYQMGAAAVAEFGATLAAIRRKDYPSAATSMLASLWAGQTPGRAQELAELMRSAA